MGKGNCRPRYRRGGPNYCNRTTCNPSAGAWPRPIGAVKPPIWPPVDRRTGGAGIHPPKPKRTRPTDKVDPGGQLARVVGARAGQSRGLREPIPPAARRSYIEGRSGRGLGLRRGRRGGKVGVRSILARPGGRTAQVLWPKQQHSAPCRNRQGADRQMVDGALGSGLAETGGTRP